MGEKNENKNKNKPKKKRRFLLLLLILFLLIPLLLFLARNTGIGKSIINFFSGDKKQEIVIPESVGENNSNQVDVEEEAEVEIGAKDENLIEEKLGKDETDLVSENYRVTQVMFGGSVIIDNGMAPERNLEISKVKGETIISQEDDEPGILISWKTNKEALSSVVYAKSDGKNPVSNTEDGYGFEHSMFLKNMEFSTIYTYRIEAKDKWGNKVATEYFSAYTGDKSESIFDLITNAVEDVFGWAMKK